MKKKKKLLKVGLFGLGISLLLISTKDSIESKILALLAALIFIYMIFGYYTFSKTE